jgi:hypothetical protein
MFISGQVSIITNNAVFSCLIFILKYFIFTRKHKASYYKRGSMNESTRTKAKSQVDR